MPVVDALLIVLLIALTVLCVLLSLATLYFVITMRDIHGSIHDIKARIHHVAAAVTDLLPNIKKHR